MPADTSTWSYERRIASESAACRAVVSDLLDELKRREWSENDVFAVHLALEEALVNAIKHGNKKDASKCVDVVCSIKSDRIRVQITDEGEGFDPEAVPDPTDEEHLEVPSGRGLMLMRCFMTTLKFNEKGNSVIMEKVRDAGEGATGEEAVGAL